MLNLLKQYLIRRWLVHPPAVWGKLPSHSDYVRYRATSVQSHDWQKWVTEVWKRRHIQQRTSKAKPAAKKRPPNWVELEASSKTFDLGAVPIAFILLPGTLSFAPKHFVQGVMVASHDAVGRECPLIIYQLARPTWISRIWRRDTAIRTARNMQRSRSNKNTPANNEQNLLYWLARAAASVHAGEFSPEALTQAVDSIWKQFSPSWAQIFGADDFTVDTSTVQTVLERLGANPELDSANGLTGVQRLPWAQWPDRLLRPETPMPAFWQQDLHGEYVNAGDNFLALWKTSK
jgi:type VI secretion system protein ImpM